MDLLPARDLTSPVVAGFRRRYAAPPAAVARAPGRLNLVGEHTDYNGGRCLPIALPHATWVAVAARADDRIRISSEAMDEAWSGSVADLRPGAVPGWAGYVAGALGALVEGYPAARRGYDVHVASTVPLGAGLSSSAALTCASVLAALAAAGLPAGPGDRVRDTVVRAAITAETRYLGAPTGGLDQAAVVWSRPGQALLLDFSPSPDQDSDQDSDQAREQGGPAATWVPWRPEDDGLVVLVVDTGVAHAHTDGGYAARRAECEEAAARLGLDALAEPSVRGTSPDGLEDLPPTLRARARHVLTEDDRVGAVVDAATARDWEGVGRALTESHASLRDDFAVSVPELDLVVDTAMTHGALGARMTGGGFGGAALALLPGDAVESVATAIDAAYRDAGLGAPSYLSGTAAGGAGVVVSGPAGRLTA